jgi:hypothetical protein
MAVRAVSMSSSCNASIALTVRNVVIERNALKQSQPIQNDADQLKLLQQQTFPQSPIRQQFRAVQDQNISRNREKTEP